MLDRDHVLLTDEEIEDVCEREEAANDWSVASLARALDLAQARKLWAAMKQLCRHTHEEDTNRITPRMRCECKKCQWDLNEVLR